MVAGQAGLQYLASLGSWGTWVCSLGEGDGSRLCRLGRVKLVFGTGGGGESGAGGRRGNWEPRVCSLLVACPTVFPLPAPDPVLTPTASDKPPAPSRIFFLFQ